MQDFSFSLGEMLCEVRPFINSIPPAGMISFGLVGRDCLKVTVLLWLLSMWVFSLGRFLFSWYLVLTLRVGVGSVRRLTRGKVLVLQTWCLEFSSQNPQKDGRRKSNLQNCLLVFTQRFGMYFTH